ncbi:predicted protein [Nematostella vectensis]|uniref:Tesmin/TSO1-like CXC domain-containing protein n=1 Tax=Nematostella vectensis TaxID=45351 RepID=A7T5N8_NEMVE|nr:predicted protein [Nematostella vectensis]|eukprot:XP_001620822.1 hypothetical protein NEMVEDRAFT_v1g222672 [Nematostella vectensis]
MPDKVKEDLCQQSTVGTQLLSRFVEERVTTATQSIWHPMKKRKLNTWKSATKIIRVKANEKVIELKEDRSLFARMSLVAKSRPEIDMKEDVGEFEFNVVPKSVFAQDGSMLHCSCKSALMAILEKVANTGAGSNTAELEIHPPIQEGTRMKERVLSKYHEGDELQLVIDRYDVPLSLKTATRVSRQGKEAPIYYKISDATHIAKIPMKRLLSHLKTKSELTEYLAVKLLEKGKGAGMNVVVAWGTRCQATHRDMAHLESNHEEADTKLLLHAVDATSFGATSIEIVSPDTDVFVLYLRRYSLLYEETSFVTGRGDRHRKIKLGPITCQNCGTSWIPCMEWSRCHRELCRHSGKSGTAIALRLRWKLEAVKCGCLKERCSTNRCQCRKAGLPCTDLCGCADDEEGEPCQNVTEEEEGSESSDEVEEEDVGDGDHD